ncbi:MAG: hypothetical protein JSV88_17725 [Candidatus Aminicenantes bacterium]|nr:MAG: hypothetical protein JSV88_17725 [Candidatus Aminicenantes bacterium]
MRYLTLIEVLLLHERLIAASGGTPGICDFSAPRFETRTSRSQKRLATEVTEITESDFSTMCPRYNVFSVAKKYCRKRVEILDKLKVFQ